jgi:hypothetical protein
MGCCRKLFVNDDGGTRQSVLNLKMVLPIKIIVLGSLAGTVFYTLKKGGHLPALAVFLIFLQLIISFLALNECRRSAAHHKILKKLSRDAS